MKIMGIESSCDETGVGIVELSEDGHMEILANAVASSMEQHLSLIHISEPTRRS